MDKQQRDSTLHRAHLVCIMHVSLTESFHLHRVYEHGECVELTLMSASVISVPPSFGEPPDVYERSVHGVTTHFAETLQHDGPASHQTAPIPLLLSEVFSPLVADASSLPPSSSLQATPSMRTTPTPSGQTPETILFAPVTTTSKRYTTSSSSSAAGFTPQFATSSLVHKHPWPSYSGQKLEVASFANSYVPPNPFFAPSPPPPSRPPLTESRFDALCATSMYFLPHSFIAPVDSPLYVHSTTSY